MSWVGFLAMLLFDAAMMWLVVWAAGAYSWGLGFWTSAALGALIVVAGAVVWAVFIALD